MRSLERVIRKVTTLLESSMSDLDEFVASAKRNISSHILERIGIFDTTISKFVGGQRATDYNLTQGPFDLLQGPYRIERTLRVVQNESTTSGEGGFSGAAETHILLKITEIGGAPYLVVDLLPVLQCWEEVKIYAGRASRTHRREVLAATFE